MKSKVLFSILALASLACGVAAELPTADRAKASIQIATVTELKHAETCVTQTVRVRSGAGMQYGEVAVLADGVPVDAVAEEKDLYGNTWLLVEFDGKSGYIAKRYVCEQ